MKHWTGLRNKSVNPLWLWTWLGLDAPSVALVWSLYFAHTQEIQIPLVHSLCLFLSVWVVYLGDRLLDSRKPSISYSSRHSFYQKYFSQMKRLFFVVLFFTFISLSFISYQLLLWGIPVTICMILYAWVAHKSQPHHFFHSAKELLVPPIFVFGISLNTIEIQPNLNLLWWGFCLTFLIFLNLVSISHWDKQHDKSSGTASLAQAAPILRPSFLVFVSAFLYGFFWNLTKGNFPTAPYWCSLLGLFLLQLLSSKLSENSRRFAVDFVLLSPLLFLW